MNVIMEIVLDDWHDFVRFGILLALTISLFSLMQHWRKFSRHWDIRARDGWFALVMWSMACMAIVIEGVYHDFEFGPRLIFMLCATIATVRVSTLNQPKNVPSS